MKSAVVQLFGFLVLLYMAFGSISVEASIYQPKAIKVKEEKKEFGLIGQQCTEGDITIFFYTEVDTMQLIYEIRDFLDHIETDYYNQIFKDGPSNESPKREIKRI